MQLEQLKQVLKQAFTLALPSLKGNSKKLPSIVKALDLQLKQLHEHVKYAHLGGKEMLPVIIRSRLSNSEEQSLIALLKNYKEVIGWTLADIKGIRPSIVMHHIELEDEAKPVRDHQRKLNPAMKEVVLAEILNLIDQWIIYPNSENKLVSLVHVVPKKSGIQVVKNEKELFQ